MRTLQIRSERRFFWMCERKKPFLSLQEAEQAIKCRRVKHGVELSVYPCPICHNYHITSQKQ